MKSVTATLSVIVLSVSRAFGGIVTFDPPAVDILPGDIGIDVFFDVSVGIEGPDIDGFDSFDLFFWPISDPYSLEMASFVFSPEAIAAFSFLYSDSSGWPPYDYQLIIGGNSAGGTVGTSMFLGTLTVDTSGLSEPGDSTTLQVDAQYEIDNLGFRMSLLGDNFGDITGMESLYGSAAITIIPEPGTLALLAVGHVEEEGRVRHVDDREVDALVRARVVDTRFRGA